jgi:hypothetical protein
VEEVQNTTTGATYLGSSRLTSQENTFPNLSKTFYHLVPTHGGYRTILQRKKERPLTDGSNHYIYHYIILAQSRAL